MAELVGGAAVGAVFGELLKAVLASKIRASMFKHTLVSLQATLISIAPLIKEIEQHNNNLGHPKEELESLIRHMEKGTNLVLECSKIHWLNLRAKICYQKKLEALGDSLLRFFIIDMQAQTARDQKETLIKVRRILSAVSKLPQVNRDDISGASSSDSVVLVSGKGSESESYYSTATQPPENAVGTDSAEVGQSKANAEHNQGKEHLRSEKSSELSLTLKNRFSGIRIPKISRFSPEVKEEIPESPLVHCKACGTFVKQIYSFYIEGYAFCNLCYNKQGHQKLVSYTFDIEDLLRADAEVLGKGSYGSTFKATLLDGRIVAVKRLREVMVGKSEFEKQVETVQTMLSEHPNVISLRACCHDKGEKLLIYDYMDAHSLSELLHGSSRTRKTTLNWDSRMKILLGAATGIAHIHSANKFFVHGNIKSSNILVTKDFQAYISDFGLNRLVRVEFSSKDGNRAPEAFRTGKLTQECDVYSFGVILREILAGKSPAWYSWETLEAVNRVGEWPDDVFDIDSKDPIKQKEMLRMLGLALNCIAKVPRLRPSMVEVVKKIEEIRSGPVAAR